MVNFLKIILFLAGLIFLFAGLAVMLYGVSQKYVKAGDTADNFKALAELINSIGNFFGPDATSKVGFTLILVGLGLIYMSTHVSF